jgi:hypothetical protein
MLAQLPMVAALPLQSAIYLYPSLSPSAPRAPTRSSLRPRPFINIMMINSIFRLLRHPPLHIVRSIVKKEILLGARKRRRLGAAGKVYTYGMKVPIEQEVHSLRTTGEISIQPRPSLISRVPNGGSELGGREIKRRRRIDENKAARNFPLARARAALPRRERDKGFANQYTRSYSLWRKDSSSTVPPAIPLPTPFFSSIRGRREEAVRPLRKGKTRASCGVENKSSRGWP